MTSKKLQRVREAQYLDRFTAFVKENSAEV